ncbi:MAG: hypothetical protein CVU77_06595 [Elusimicrobia bacterium HGW-Elusimicrobia-1]|nr:MAG: hypothetical protein CVU77_06595 [Elusimicrobia bacterium HGW-Elusimicrobia-1]
MLTPRRWLDGKNKKLPGVDDHPTGDKLSELIQSGGALRVWLDFGVAFVKIAANKSLSLTLSSLCFSSTMRNGSAPELSKIIHVLKNGR